MTVKERVLSIRIAEQGKKNTDYLKQIGVECIIKEHRKEDDG